MNASDFDPSTYLTEGSDNSPPLKRISSRDSEVCGRKEGYSARRRSSLSHVASFSEWCDHCTFRNWIKNTNRVLSIRNVILEIKRFMVDFVDGVLEATPELGHMEYIMYSGKVWR